MLLPHFHYWGGGTGDGTQHDTPHMQGNAENGGFAFTDPLIINGTSFRYAI